MMKSLNLILLMAVMLCVCSGCQSTGGRYAAADAYQVGTPYQVGNPLPVESNSGTTGYQSSGCQSCGKSHF